ncbi:hypothetical protein K443DRAFT_9189 [Laccaria amethystina LaAM-08-1]|uniref:Uncharacterized protein n=1 Tax=Laccaria amethystina LaAM-08-1 TaxID=1095629 RepID=A0A0C9WMS9_9AGAR|nr:hypothetical protein K443DRAFT_9189 [Laccaria amethystina LaAM-08-1]
MKYSEYLGKRADDRPNVIEGVRRIGLPERRNPLIVWTVVDDSKKIILDSDEDGSNKDQLWKFERIDNLPKPE